MSNYTDQHDKLAVHLQELYKRHRTLDDEIKVFIEENKDQLKREYIDFRYVILNPKNLIGIDEFNQDFFDEIDEIENKISQGTSFENILENIWNIFGKYLWNILKNILENYGSIKR